MAMAEVARPHSRPVHNGTRKRHIANALAAVCANVVQPPEIVVVRSRSLGGLLLRQLSRLSPEVVADSLPVLPAVAEPPVEARSHVHAPVPVSRIVRTDDLPPRLASPVPCQAAIRPIALEQRLAGLPDV